MRIQFQLPGQGASTIELNEGECNYQSALSAFERLNERAMANYDLFVNGKKVKDLTETIEDGTVVTAVSSKNESAARITFQLPGQAQSTFETDEDECDYQSALATFERLNERAMKNYDLFVNGKKVKDLSETIEDGAVVTVVSSKNESAARITFQLPGQAQSTFETDEDECDYQSALATFERLNERAMTNYDLFVNGKKVKDLSETIEDGTTVTVVSSKNESAV